VNEDRDDASLKGAALDGGQSRRTLTEAFMTVSNDNGLLIDDYVSTSSASSYSLSSETKQTTSASTTRNAHLDSRHA
jgi:hypothetical protein